MKRFLIFAMAVLLVTTLGVGTVVGAGQEEVEPDAVELLYVEWECAIAKTHTAQVVLEEMGYDVQLTAVDAGPMWSGIAAQDADGFVCAWLPGTHGSYYEQTEGEVEHLSPVLEGARIGLMVPTYVDIDSIEELNDYADRFDNEIVGIEPGAGIMEATDLALEEYDLDFSLIESSDAAMQSALAERYDQEEWVVVTGWTPHPKEARHDLKYLEDPQEVYGGEEYIGAVVRHGLAEDMPEVYEFLDNMYWEVEELAELMGWNADQEYGDEYDNAQEWVDQNRDVVEEWLP